MKGMEVRENIAFKAQQVKDQWHFTGMIYKELALESSHSLFRKELSSFPFYR